MLKKQILQLHNNRTSAPILEQARLELILLAIANQIRVLLIACENHDSKLKDKEEWVELKRYLIE